MSKSLFIKGWEPIDDQRTDLMQVQINEPVSLLGLFKGPIQDNYISEKPIPARVTAPESDSPGTTCTVCRQLVGQRTSSLS